jgi:hypothetical protein
MPEAEELRTKHPNLDYPVRVETWFDELGPDEKLLARIVWRVRGQNFPTRAELSAYFEPRITGSVKASLADLLSLGELWEMSADWAPGILALYDNTQELSRYEQHILDSLLLDITWWYEAEPHLIERSVDPHRALRDQINSKLPWSHVYRAKQFLPGGISVENTGIALETFAYLVGQTPAAFSLGSAINNFTSEDLTDWSKDNVSKGAVWIWGRASSAAYFYELADESISNLDGIPPFELLREELAIYGHPVFQQKLAFSYWEGETTLDAERALPLLESAASHGMEGSVEWLLQKAVTEGRFRDAFRLSLHRSAQGAIALEEFGYVFSYLMAANAFDTSEAEKWRDFLAYMCQNQPLPEPQRAVCPANVAAKEYLPVRQDLLTYLDTADIVEAGAYDLETGNYYALLIGNSKYDAWTDLNTPIEDISALDTILREQYGFKVSTVADGSRREILRAIYDLGSKANFQDHVLVYYAGHGVIDRTSDTAYWIPSDAGRDFAPDWVSADEVLNAFKSVSARHLMLVADSCYSGTLLRGDAPITANASESAVKRLFQKKARVALTSGGEEPVADSLSGSKHSVFASSLLGALRENQSPLPASTLYGRLLSDVSSEAAQTPQYADMRELGHDGGDFIFVPVGW